MLKNASRAVVVTITIVMALVIYNKLESFLSIVGSLTCTPIAFILPAWFHLKACADTPKKKAIDITVLVVSIFLLIYCTIFAILAW
jgi:proton-coupled amino acid transporter